MTNTTTTTSTSPPVKYITRPRPEGTLYGCQFCSKRITLYVRPTEVMHKCLRTHKWSQLKPQ